MKKKTSFLLPLLMAIVMMAMSPMKMWAYDEPQSETIEGKTWYKIATASELLWFMEKEVTNTDYPYTEYYAKLTADIVINQSVLNADGTLNGTPSVTWIMPEYFAGCLDGDGYTISGIYLPDDIDKTRAMVNQNRGTIKNLGILDSYIGKGYQNASFATGNMGGSITDCYSYATVGGTASLYSGGIVAYNQGYVTNCYFAGKMTTNTSDSSPIIGKNDTSYGYKYKNNYYLSTTLLSGMNTAVGTSVSTEDFASGRLAMLLQAGRTTAVWGQNIDKSTPYDAHPVINGPAVYANKYNCNETVASDAQFSNTAYASVTTAEHVLNTDPTHHAATCTKGSYYTYTCTICGKSVNSAEADDKVAHTLDSHEGAQNATCSAEGWYEYWKCSVCYGYFSDAQGTNQYDKEYKDDSNNGVWIAKLPHTTSADYDENGLKICSVCNNIDCEAPSLVNDASSAFNNYYAIKNAGNMLWFKQKVGTTPNINGYLVNNVDLSSVCHAANAETGATMLSWEPICSNGFYLGTFDGNNKAITGLYVNGQSRNALFAGIGEGSKVVNLTVEGNVTGVNAAIIVSMSSGNAEITNCISRGSVTSSGDNTAGVLGSDNSYPNPNAKVTYCTNYATVTSSRNNTGGVVGYNPLKVEHCVNHGDVTGNNQTGGVVGNMTTSTNPVSDCANYGSVTSNGSTTSHVGGVVGLGYGVSRCSNHGNVTATSATNVGGVIGNSQSGSNEYGFKECLNTGDIKGKLNVGGLVGCLYKNNNSNSYSIGKVEAANSNGGLLIGYYNNNPSSALSNVYYVKGATVKVNGVETANKIQGGGETINASQNVGKSKAEFASGEVCYLLNGSRSAGTAESPLLWYQKLGNGGDSSPVLTAAEGNTVYAGYDQCLYSYTNTAGLLAAQQGEHNYGDNGICLKCSDYYEPATQITATNRSQFGFTDATHDDYYAISNVGQLAWFRDFVNTSVTEGGSTTYPNASANAVLTADIDMSPVCHAANDETGATMLIWEPIGGMSKYLGTFDGNSKAITGLYVNDVNGENRNALFAAIGDDSKVKNLTVEGNVTGTNAAIIVSMSYGNAEITNCVSKGSVTSSDDNTAGVLGSGEGKVTYCTNYATVTSSGNNIGGVVGNISSSTNPVSDCANYGNVTSNGSNYNVGGIVGSGYSAIRCSNYGNVTAESTNNVGGVIGSSQNGSNEYGFKECLNTGDIKGKKNVGGLVGILYKDNNADSYSTGKVEAASSDGGLLIGYYYNDPSSALSNVFYVKGATVKVNGVETANQIQGGGYTINASQNVGKSKAEFASGEVCYLLNGSRSAGTAESPLLWYQRIGADASPTFDQNQYAIVKYDATDGYYNDIENFASIEIQDGVAYEAKLKRTTDQLTYKRTFANTTYNALYVPFAMQYSDWSEKADIYRLLNIFEEDEDDNGTIDKWVLKVVKLKEGESTKANTPYIIKPKTEGEMTLTLQNVLLAPAQEKSIWCASTDYKFVFKGSYAEKAIAADSYFFVSTTGGLQYSNEAETLKPQRWYMGIYNKDTDALVAPSTFNTTANNVKGIRISVEGDDETTGIADVNDNANGNNGKRLENGRIVILKNGKKYNTSGQQIK